MRVRGGALGELPGRPVQRERGCFQQVVPPGVRDQGRSSVGEGWSAVLELALEVRVDDRAVGILLGLPEVHLARDQAQVVVASQTGGPDPAVPGALPVTVQQRSGRVRRVEDRPPGAHDRCVGDGDADRLGVHRRLEDQRVDDPVALRSVDRDVDRGAAVRDDERRGELGVLRVARMQHRQRLAAVDPWHLEPGEVVAEGQVAGEDAQAVTARRQAPDPEDTSSGAEHEVALRGPRRPGPGRRVRPPRPTRTPVPRRTRSVPTRT